MKACKAVVRHLCVDGLAKIAGHSQKFAKKSNYNLSMKLRLIPFLVAYVALAFSQTAEKPSVSVRAASQVVVGSMIQLRGEVEIVTPTITLHADEADFDVSTGIIEARGNVRAARRGISIENMAPAARSARLDINQRGIMFRLPLQR